ncbi:hypothetical protein GCM10010524_33410 [Streptomyces mexicanus]
MTAAAKVGTAASRAGGGARPRRASTWNTDAGTGVARDMGTQPARPRGPPSPGEARGREGVPSRAWPRGLEQLLDEKAILPTERGE